MNTTSNAPARFEDALLPVLVEELEHRDAHAAWQPSPPRRRRTWAVAIAIAAAATAIALVIPAVWPGGPTGADPAAAAMLRKVARRAAAQPAMPAPEPGQFVYTKTESVQTSLYVTGNGPSTNFLFVQPLTREAWIGTDGSARIYETTGALTFPSDRDRAAWVAAGSPDLGSGAVNDETYGPVVGGYLDTSVLPADPQALRDLIEQRQIVGGPDGDWETFSIIGDLLRETSVPPAVRGALYEVAADLPGVELVGKVEDASGRPGIAVAFTHGGVRQEFIFDPKTAELLGENYVNVENTTIDMENAGPGAIYPSGEAGTVFFTATYLASGVVASTQERPKGAKAG
jgi:hypothetical protein